MSTRNDGNEGYNPQNRSSGRRRSRRGRGGARGGNDAGGQKSNSARSDTASAERQGSTDGSPDASKGGNNRSPKGRAQNQKGQGNKKGQGNRQQKSGGNRPPSNKRNRKRRKPSHGGTGFWGDPAKLPAIHADIRITDEPAAVPRSLGPPPLPGHEQIAVHYFAAVYDRAVGTAGALAAAGGLIDPESLVDSGE